MNDVLVSLANITKDMMNYDPTLMIIGRDNATQENFSKNYIVFDTLASNPVSKKREYDPELERELFTTTMQGTFTVEFYGSNARQNHINFINLLGSQESRYSQLQNDITIFNPNSSNNRKMQTNSRFYERYEVEVIVQYKIKTEIDRLRIDEIPTNFTYDKE